MHDMESWRLAGHLASVRLPSVTAQVDLARPHLGIQAWRVGSHAAVGQLLSLAPSDSSGTWPAEVADAYVRGSDLVASYAGSDAWPYAPQVYWSVPPTSTGAVLAALGLTVSIQTKLLDTHPRLAVRSGMPAAEALIVTVVGDDLLVDTHIEGVPEIDPRSSACGIVWRLADGQPSYAEVMPTSDFRQVAVAQGADGQIECRWELFGEFLEKGVIRRARLQAMFLPREDDVQLVAECGWEIESRPLPLTT